MKVVNLWYLVGIPDSLTKHLVFPFSVSGNDLSETQREILREAQDKVRAAGGGLARPIRSYEIDGEPFSTLEFTRLTYTNEYGAESESATTKFVPVWALNALLVPNNSFEKTVYTNAWNVLTKEQAHKLNAFLTYINARYGEGRFVVLSMSPIYFDYENDVTDAVEPCVSVRYMVN